MKQTAAEFVQSFADAGTPLKLARRESSLARLQRMSSWRDADQNITQDERRDREHYIERACRDWISVCARSMDTTVERLRFGLQRFGATEYHFTSDDIAFIRSRFARYASEQ